MHCSHVIHQSISLSFIHFSYLHSYQQFIHYPFIVHLVNSPFILHSPPIHHHTFTTNPPSIYLSSLISLVLIHIPIQLDTQPAIILPSVCPLSSSNHSSIYHASAINLHLSCKSFVPHPFILYAPIHLSLIHLSIHHLSTCHFSCINQHLFISIIHKLIINLPI
jgi:hypothetical protein